MRTQNILMAAAGAVVAMGFSSCSMNKPGGGLSSYHSYDRPTKMPGNRSAVKVKVSLSKQRVYVMEGSEMLLAMPVSVGAPGTSTPSGSFRIFKKEAKHRANSHGYAYSGNQVKKTMLSGKPGGWSFKGTPMPYWCEFKPNYGFHTGWVKHTPCTHGCIRMHENLSPKFYQLVSVGTPVNISYSQPEDEKWSSMSLPPDAGPLPDYNPTMYTGDGYFSQHKAPKYN
ncbi:MAG: L,D-transpeptidase [Armatimonadetes bacterium]|nr:L,D-transpeptidase [Akkermansiaceae bacterium]